MKWYVYTDDTGNILENVYETLLFKQLMNTNRKISLFQASREIEKATKIPTLRELEKLIEACSKAFKERSSFQK